MGKSVVIISFCAWVAYLLLFTAYLAMFLFQAMP
jgi:hypothetical protein